MMLAILPSSIDDVLIRLARGGCTLINRGAGHARAAPTMSLCLFVRVHGRLDGDPETCKSSTAGSTKSLWTNTGQNVLAWVDGGQHDFDTARARASDRINSKWFFKGLNVTHVCCNISLFLQRLTGGCSSVRESIA